MNYRIITVLLVVLNIFITLANANSVTPNDCPTYPLEKFQEYIAKKFSPDRQMVFPTVYRYYNVANDEKKIYVPGTAKDSKEPLWSATNAQIDNYARYIMEYNRYRHAQFCSEADMDDKGKAYLWGSFRGNKNGIHKGEALHLGSVYIGDSVCEGGLPDTNMRACNCIQNADTTKKNYNPLTDCKNHTPLGEDKRYTLSEGDYFRGKQKLRSSEYWLEFRLDARRTNPDCDRSNTNWLDVPGQWSYAIPGVKNGKLDFSAHPYKGYYDNYMSDKDDGPADPCKCGWDSLFVATLTPFPKNYYLVAHLAAMGYTRIAMAYGYTFTHHSPNIMCLANSYRKFDVSDDASFPPLAVGFNTKMEKGRVCLYAGEQFVGCRVAPEGIKYPPPDLSCFMDAPECSFDNMSVGVRSKWFFPLTSSLVQCVTAATNALFIGEGGHCYEKGEWSTTLFGKMQENIQGAIMMAFTLYVILIGINMLLGNYGSQKDFMESLVKIMLVAYFSIGDAWKEYYLLLIGSISDLVAIVLEAGLRANDHLDYCTFDPALYDEGWEHIRLWDIIDCRIYYYLGFGKDGNVASLFNIPALAQGIITSNFIFSIVLLIICFIFALMIISIAKEYIISILVMSILVFVSPIFIPMVLFNSTKQFFDNWKSQLIGYSLFPVVLFAFLGMFLYTFDMLFWGKASEGVKISNFDPTNGFFDLDCTAPNGKNSVVKLGCLLYPDTVNNNGLEKEIFVELAIVFGVLYLFYYFMNDLSDFVKGLAGIQQTLTSSGSGGNYLSSAASSLMKPIRKAKQKKGKDDDGDKAKQKAQQEKRDRFEKAGDDDQQDERYEHEHEHDDD